MTILPILEELTRIYGELNKEFYEGKLPGAILTIQSTKAIGTKAFGWAAKDRWVTIDGERFYELNITPEYLTRDKYNVISTLNHEMVHIYCWENDIKDTSNLGRYHNKYFKNEAEKRGLLISKNGMFGFSKTEPSEMFKEYIDTLDVADVFTMCRGDLEKSAEDTGEKKKRKKRGYYECPSCGEIVRAKKGLNLAHVDCGVDFEWVEPEDEDDD